MKSLSEAKLKYGFLKNVKFHFCPVFLGYFMALPTISLWDLCMKMWGHYFSQKRWRALLKPKMRYTSLKMPLFHFSNPFLTTAKFLMLKYSGLSNFIYWNRCTKSKRVTMEHFAELKWNDPIQGVPHHQPKICSFPPPEETPPSRHMQKSPPSRLPPPTKG